MTTESKSKRGQKFTEKYAGIRTRQAYACDPDQLTIPPKGHALYDPDGNQHFDELRVKEIDEDGEFTGAVIIWSDPNQNKLFVVEGRGCVLDVKEVNRRRRERGDKPIEIVCMRLNVSLERAAEHVRLRNFHRKTPGYGQIAREIVLMNRQGKTPERMRELLHLGEDWTERMLRQLAPLAFCIPDVEAAFEAEKIPRSAIKKFGGKALDGSERLGDEEQQLLLAEMLSPKEKASTAPRSIPAAARARAVEALGNGATKELSQTDAIVAEIVRAALQLAGGDSAALEKWPAVAAIVDKALEKPAPAAEESAK